jgi:hypothetical protein
MCGRAEVKRSGWWLDVRLVCAGPEIVRVSNKSDLTKTSAGPSPGRLSAKRQR